MMLGQIKPVFCNACAVVALFALTWDAAFIHLVMSSDFYFVIVRSENALRRF